MNSLLPAMLLLGAGAAPEAKIDFNRDVRPILADHCYQCHGPDAGKRKANLRLDVRRVKEKVEAGAHYVVTQMFFDNRHYFQFVDLCREQGINVPIIPGLKILTSERQLSSIPRKFYVEVPATLADEVIANPEHVADIGIEWAAVQSQELLDRGVPSLHFYVMQSATAIKKLMARLKL